MALSLCKLFFCCWPLNFDILVHSFHSVCFCAREVPHPCPGSALCSGRWLSVTALILLNTSSFCRAQAASLSPGWQEWQEFLGEERRGLPEKTRAIWWLYGGVVGSRSVPSTTHTAPGSPHSLVWCRPAPSGFSQAALSSPLSLSPSATTPSLLLPDCAAVQ